MTSSWSVANMVLFAEEAKTFIHRSEMFANKIIRANNSTAKVSAVLFLRYFLYH